MDGNIWIDPESIHALPVNLLPDLRCLNLILSDFIFSHHSWQSTLTGYISEAQKTALIQNIMCKVDALRQKARKQVSAAMLETL